MDTLTAGMLAQVIQQPQKVPLARYSSAWAERCAAILAVSLDH